MAVSGIGRYDDGFHNDVEVAFGNLKLWSSLFVGGTGEN